MNGKKPKSEDEKFVEALLEINRTKRETPERELYTLKKSAPEEAAEQSELKTEDDG